VTPEVHIALLHHPVLNRAKEIVATAVTNLDIHDNARSAKTYGVASYHLVTPLDAQIELVTRILAHWREGFGAARVPDRSDALSLVHIQRTLDDAVAHITALSGTPPVLVATCARSKGSSVSWRDMRARMASHGGPYLILFGTGHGLADEVLERADVLLAPIGTPTQWNHLSVRSAVAICLDRLLGDW